MLTFSCLDKSDECYFHFHSETRLCSVRCNNVVPYHRIPILSQCSKGQSFTSTYAYNQFYDKAAALPPTCNGQVFGQHGKIGVIIDWIANKVLSCGLPSRSSFLVICKPQLFE